MRAAPSWLFSTGCGSWGTSLNRMQTTTSSNELAGRGAGLIRDGFLAFHHQFQSITNRAQARFENRDWPGIQQDAQERLVLYNRVVMQVVGRLHDLLGDDYRNKLVWASMKHSYSLFIEGLEDFELAETFFNSATRRIFATVGVDPEIEFVASDLENPNPQFEIPIFRSYSLNGTWTQLVLEILHDYPFQVSYADITGDAALAARQIESYLKSLQPAGKVEAVDVLRPIFYRNKGAYIIGRIRIAGGWIPLVFSLRHPLPGVHLDAVLLMEDDVSIIFSFTRSYFHVESARPRQLISFLKTIMPVKRIAELYISIGYNKHGKTELYRDLLQHLAKSTDQFQTARGEKGMVMLVFTLPSYDLVFKVIRDHFPEPKNTSRQEVMDRYQLVFKHDRAGRLVDAQEFEHLTFDAKRFSPALLEELLEGAPSSIRVEGESVSIRHLYIERRLTPLNLYLEETGSESAREAVIDYGYTIKDLAATNIFPGDILLKNFGVTRHGRVVFYDYDELGLLTTCRFRSIPKARSLHQEFEASPWFYVGPHDIFPEEFKTFLGLQGELRDIFVEHHADLFEANFWRSIQERLESGEIVDIYPYKQSRRLHQNGGELEDRTPGYRSRS
jgi:isocitrate dehydrogenase kinase/phosphatase